MADGSEENVSKEQNDINDEVIDENGVESEGGFSDPEDFEDDVSDSELLDDVLAKQPKETDGVESVIVIDGIPKVETSRNQKLVNVIRKIYYKFGNIRNEFYPVDENGTTKGYAFIEFESPAVAIEAAKVTKTYKLDKNHTFQVNLVTDFNRYQDVPEDWSAPEAKPYTGLGNLRYWLQNADCYDQYSIISEGGGKTSIWYNSLPEATLIEERACWTETYVAWSPLGIYFATLHQKGIALWGGENFQQIMKFGHNGVQFIDFSPSEKYLITFSSIPDNREDSQSVIIWDIRTGIKKRKFDIDGQPVWPIFKWSHDDRYFGRLGNDVLSIYETPSFGLLDKKSMKVPGIRDFSWSPTDNMLSYWVGEDKDVPARVSLIEIPSRKELRSNNLFNVADCKMHWQKSGNYLCVKVDRYSKYSKSKKEKSEKPEVKYTVRAAIVDSHDVTEAQSFTKMALFHIDLSSDEDTFHNYASREGIQPHRFKPKRKGMYSKFEVFHVKEKQIPVDGIEVKDSITAFAWEPVGNKFAIIHGENPNINVSFYSTKAGITLLKKWERKQCNNLFWAPNGQFIILAGLRNMSGTLEFIDTADMTVMAQQEHFMASDVEWDPTGRYVMTGVSYWGYKFDNAYWIWSFQGKLLQKQSCERFCQFLWRPRPSTLLTIQEIKDLKKNIKKYSAQFEMKDRMQLTKASKELIEKRRKMMDEFEAYRQSRIDVYEEQREMRLQLRDSKENEKTKLQKILYAIKNTVAEENYPYQNREIRTGATKTVLEYLKELPETEDFLLKTFKFGRNLINLFLLQ
ncbi:Eukaryotic translation initiation factor 3 subunit B [Nymphon striatum]|nr:Eukaryotic translation initiation factor 3 subunit B [Nymphon striatum]